MTIGASCFGESFVSATMVLCILDELLFRSSDGLRDHVFLAQGLSACFATVQGLFLDRPAMKIDVELTPINEYEL